MSVGGVLSKEAAKAIDAIVAAYEAEMPTVRTFRTQLIGTLTESRVLTPHVHSFKSRIKDVDHLRHKLELRTLALPPGSALDVTPDNLLTKINDLVGIRILHLYTRQIRQINAALQATLHEQQFGLVEGPIASTWDDEYRDFFGECGIDTRASKSMYTSVHYVVSSASRTQVTAEIQVRTLMEEVWGEVSHKINYPDPTTSSACAEELKVLARVTSSATRLVDTIFRNFEEHSQQVSAVPAKQPRRRSRAKPGQTPGR